MAYADLGVAPLLLQVQNPAELVGLCSCTTTSSPLSMNEHNAGILLQALSAFLVSDQSVANTALRLGIHRNTLHYRLRKVEELLAHLAQRYRLLLELQLACTVLNSSIQQLQRYLICRILRTSRKIDMIGKLLSFAF